MSALRRDVGSRSHAADLALLAGRVIAGGYLAAHGAQKLFGTFGGAGLEGTAAGFQHMGLTPATPMAALAGVTELVGGALTVTGTAHPLGPIALTGSLSVACAVHRPGGAFAPKGIELPAAFIAASLALAGAGPGRLRLGPSLPARIAALAAAAGAAAAVRSIVQVDRRRKAVAAAKAVPPTV